MATQGQPAPSGNADGLNPAVTTCGSSAPKATGDLSVYVCAHAPKRPPIKQAGVLPLNLQTNAPLGAQQTDQNGHSVYSGIAPAVYKVTVTLTGDNFKNYAWPSTDNASSDSTDTVYANQVRFYPFLVIPLARPKIQVLWQEDNSAVSGVKVLLETIALSDTADDGISQLADGARGLRANSFHVHFTFASKNVELMDDRQITVPQGSSDTYPFHIRKCWVEFVVKDNFGTVLETADYVLTYPSTDGRAPESGTLASGDNGTVHKEVPPGEYKFELKWLSEPSWGDQAAVVDKPIDLSVKSTGFSAGDISFDIYDACSPSGTALDTVTASALKDEIAQGKWTPAIAKLDKVTSGLVVFVAKAGTRTVTSAPIPISSKRVFNVTGPDNGPLDTELTLIFSDGLKLTAQSKGGTAEPLVPLGNHLVSVQIPQKGVYPSFQVEGSSDKQNCYIPPAQG